MIGTLDTESLREFFSYNINTKLNTQEATSIIYYFNGSLHRFSNTISLSDLVKDMKLLALEMPSAILAPPSASHSELQNSTNPPEEWYNNWCNQKVHGIEEYFHHESQRILGSMASVGGSGVGSHLNRIKKNKYFLQHNSNNCQKSQDDNDDNYDNDGNGNDNENKNENDDDDDKTISTLGMESVNSIPNKLSSKKLTVHQVSSHKNNNKINK